jgi:hypothetical protein
MEFYAFVLILRQFLLITVNRPGCTRRPLPYFLGTAQKGAHRVCLPTFASRNFLLK